MEKDDRLHDILADITVADQHDINEDHLGEKVEILYHNTTEDGTCAAVYEVAGVRRYRAMEYCIGDDGSWTQQYGYDTENKHWYMGERYRGLFGPYEGEVFFQ